MGDVVFVILSILVALWFLWEFFGTLQNAKKFNSESRNRTTELIEELDYRTAKRVDVKVKEPQKGE